MPLKKTFSRTGATQQTIPHLAVWLTVDPHVFVCSDIHHDRRTNTGNGENESDGTRFGEKKEEEEEVGLFHEIEG